MPTPQAADESPAQPTQASRARFFAEHSALSTVVPGILRMLRREPALAITLGYLLVAVVGIFYNYRYYAQFNIPVLTLSQVGDFLVAGIQQPIALLLVLSTFPLCWLFDLMNARSRRRGIVARERLRALALPTALQRLRLRWLDWRIGQRWYTQLAYVAVIAGYGWMFVALYADRRAADVRAGRSAQVKVWIGDQASALTPPQAKAWTYLGAIASYVFVFDALAGRTEVLPVENVARIEPVAIAEPRADAPRGPLLLPIP